MAISYLWQSGGKKEKEFELGQGWLTVMVVFRSFFFPLQLDSFAANDCQLEGSCLKLWEAVSTPWWQIRSYIIKLLNINKLSSLSSTRFQDWGTNTLGRQYPTTNDGTVHGVPFISTSQYLQAQLATIFHRARRPTPNASQVLACRSWRSQGLYRQPYSSYPLWAPYKKR